MVDEAKESYVKNQLDLDTINENKPVTEKNASPSAPEDGGSAGTPQLQGRPKVREV